MQEKIIELLENKELSEKVLKKLNFLKPLFEKLNYPMLSQESYVECNPCKVNIYLEHFGDSRTNVRFIIDDYEIVISINGLAIYFYFDELNDISLKDIYFTANQVLNGEYFVNNYFDSNGNLIKSELEFESSKLKKQTYTSLLNLIKSKLIKLNQEKYHGLRLMM